VVAAFAGHGERERASAAARLRAVALGYDVCCRLTQSLNAVQFRAAGHRRTASADLRRGRVAGALARLDADAPGTCSPTPPSGLRDSCWMRDEEHIEKAFDFGGIRRATPVARRPMVAQGFTGLEDVLSGERNFFVGYGARPIPRRLVRELGTRYEIMHTEIKRWRRLAHPARRSIRC